MVVPIVNHATIKIGCVGGHNWAKHWIGLGWLIFHNWAISTFNNVILFNKEDLYITNMGNKSRCCYNIITSHMEFCLPYGSFPCNDIVISECQTIAPWLKQN